MKKTLVALAAALMAVSFTVGTAPAVRADKPVVAPKAGGKDPLNLTPEQQQKIQAITMKAMQEVQPIMADQKLTQQQKQAKLQAINKKYEPQVMALLTKDQQKKLKEMTAGVKADLQARANKRKQLDKSLTPAQRLKIQKITDKFQADAMKYGNDPKLTPEQKAAKIRALNAQRIKDTDAVLTPAQRKLAH